MATVHPDAPVLTLTAPGRALLLDALRHYRQSVLATVEQARRLGVEDVGALMDRHTEIGDVEDVIRAVRP